MGARIIEHVTIHKAAGRYCAFPDLALLPDGRVIVVFREADFDWESFKRTRRVDHLDPSSHLTALTSADGGRTWGDYRVIHDKSPAYGEQDPSIARLRDGRLMVNFFRWRVLPPARKDELLCVTYTLPNGNVADYEGPFVITSRDGGRSWDAEPTRVDSAPLPRAGCSDAVLELADGTLLLPAYGGEPGSTFARAYVIRSRDGGRTWGEPGLIAQHPEGALSFEEPALCDLGDGRLLATLRAGVYRVGYEYLYRAFSDDGGLTWHSLEETPMWGHPSHLLHLQDGRVLCTYGYRRESFGVRACLSADGGVTWDIAHEVVLRDDATNGDCGYPSSVQLPDGTLVTAYYTHGDDEIRHIAATRWRV